jgi:hypothetical protein
MSDGPHRSLDQRPKWKKAAEYADKGAFTREDVMNASEAALTDDWRIDVPQNLARSVCEIFGGQKSLFRDQTTSDLDALRRLHAGHGMGQLLIDCALQLASKGKSGPEAAVEAAANTLAVWSSRHTRQIEEHYCRKASQRRADNVRTRLEDGISSVQHGALARQLLKLDGGAAPQKPQKQTGLDDGVTL